MSQYGSWSVKGVDDRARAIAKEKARLKGVTLGDYINNLLLEGHSEAGPRDTSFYDDMHRPRTFVEPHAPTPLDHLAQRIEAVEARSTLAITGIDQSVLGLLARLEGTENSTAAMTAEVERMVDELRETHETLHDKVGALEADESGRKSLEAMKALEDALGKLAAHVYEEGRLSQDESSAMKGRVEAGFSEINDRVEGIEVKVESTLANAAERVEKAVAEAELRTEGASRHLSERVSAIESGVATKLAKVDEIDTRVNAVEGDVSGAITSMESTLARIQDRLHRAESTTDSALKALEGTFAHLDERIDAVAEMANPAKADQLRQELEAQFETLATDLRASVEHTRRHLANEIERAAAGQNPELMGALETRVNALETSDFNDRMESDLSARINEVSDQLNGQIVDVSTTLAERIAESEDRNASAIEQIGEQVSGLSDTLNQGVIESERRSAAAIEQVGEQVAAAVKQVQARQEQGQRQLSETVAASEKRQEMRLSDALGNVSNRLAEMQSQTVSAMSPVQRAIVSLAGRLEALEDFNAPPLSEPNVETLPEMPALEIDSSPIELSDMAEPEAPDAEEESGPYIPDEPMASEASAAPPLEEADFLAALPDFDDDPDFSNQDAEQGTEEWDHTAEQAEAQSEFATEEPVYEELEHEDPLIEATAADPLDVYSDDQDLAADTADENDLLPYAEDLASEDDDPLTELGSWDDAQEEARDSDVFGAESDFDDDDTDLSDILQVFEEEELAHNTDAATIDELADEAPAEDEAVLEEDPAPLDDPSDYLSRARNAAIAAATTPRSGGTGRRSAASLSTKGSGKKFPVMVAASALAVAAAGAGGWVALRGKTPPADANVPDIATKSSLVDTAATSNPADEPSLSGIEFTELAPESLEDTLFAEDGSLDPVALEPTAAPPARVELPQIPAALTLQQAAINGSAVAQYLWGNQRLEAQDYAVGADFISLAAQQGLPAAQYRLAKLHERGTGVPRDLTEARAWTERAANGGNVNAMHDLAVFFADGEGGAQSYAAAAEWFRKAADFGVLDSQYNLALLYENGLGISPSQTEALYWFEIAAANGDASAPGNVATIREALPIETAQEVQQRAAAWTVSTKDAAANGSFGSQAWDQASRTQVMALQTVLNGLGYDAGPADGLAGAGTRTAIRAFQVDHGLPTTGSIDDELIDALNAQTQGLAG